MLSRRAAISHLNLFESESKYNQQFIYTWIQNSGLDCTNVITVEGGLNCKC